MDNWLSDQIEIWEEKLRDLYSKSRIENEKYINETCTDSEHYSTVGNFYDREINICSAYIDAYKTVLDKVIKNK